LDRLPDLKKWSITILPEKAKRFADWQVNWNN